MSEILLPPPPDSFSLFLGELSDAEFISYRSVGTTTGVGGSNLSNQGAGWLEFELEGQTLIVAKKNIMHSVSWQTLNTLGLVFGTKTITVNGVDYKVRLLKGADTDPSVIGAGYYYPGTHNSEWSRLFYPIIRDDSKIPTPPRDAGALYTQAELNMNSSFYSWCQEVSGSNPTQRIVRGYYACSYFTRQVSTSVSISVGWRPCFEKI